jgi:hypothetical protein
MKEEHILKDIDSLCRDLIACIQSSERLINEKRIDKVESAEKISGMVVDMRSLLHELRQSKIILAGAPERLNAIAQIASLCKDLEGMVKEIRNDLRSAGTETESEL